MARLEIDAATNQALAAVQLHEEAIVDVDYLFWFLQSNYLSLRALAAGGVQPNLNLGIIRKIKVPMPPLDEQIEIAKRIRSMFADIHRIVLESKKAAALVDHLDQANLAKAFRGDLVLQDPNDEPASVILETIRLERQADQRAKRSRKRESKGAVA